VEIAHFRGSRGAKGFLHCLFRRDAPFKSLSVRGVQFLLIYSLRIGSWIDPAGIIAEPVPTYLSRTTLSHTSLTFFRTLGYDIVYPITAILARNDVVSEVYTDFESVDWRGMLESG
jgi:hypothetical protein